MNRLRFVIAAVLGAALALAAGAWFWLPDSQLASSPDPLGPRVETRRLEVGVDEQRQDVDSLTTRLDAGLKDLDALEQRAAALTERYREHAPKAQGTDHLPGTLEDIVARRTAYLRSRDGAGERDDERRISALSSDTGIPPDRIREALGR